MTNNNYKDGLEALVKAIQDSERPEAINVSDDSYTTKPVYKTPGKHSVEPLTVHTLSGLVKYVIATSADADDAEYLIQVKDQQKVYLYDAKLRQDRTRECYLIADCFEWLDKFFNFNRFYGQTDFSIFLQTGFVRTEQINQLLKVTGNVTDATAKTSVDDGVTQSVSAKTGLALEESVKLPNILNLAPYSTFQEITQPDRAFIFRAQQSRDPEFALFESGSSEWKSKAITNIKSYLDQQLIELNIPIIA